MQPLASALKTLALLDHFGHCSGAQRLADLARNLEAGRATVYQRLVTLIAAGWVEQTPDGRFRLTLRATRLARAATEQAGFGDRTLPVLEALMAETGEAASLAVLEEGEPRIIQRVEPRGVLRVEMRIGATMSLRESASGRVLLAFGGPRAEAEARAHGHALPNDEVLAEVRASGHSISSGRSIEGIRAAAVPVFDGAGACIAALSLVAPAHRFATDGWIGPLRAAALRLRDLMEGQTA